MGTHNLPTAEQLTRLPLRAIAAYAARAARRAQPMLQGVVDDHIIEEALSILERVVSAKHLDSEDPVSVVLANSRVVGEAIPLAGPPEIAVLAIESAIYAAFAVLQGTLRTNEEMTFNCIQAAEAAARAADRTVRALEEPVATVAAIAAQRDYETLVKRFGEHDSVIVGEPIDIWDETFWGTLMSDVPPSLSDDHTNTANPLNATPEADPTPNEH